MMNDVEVLVRDERPCMWEDGVHPRKVAQPALTTRDQSVLVIWRDLAEVTERRVMQAPCCHIAFNSLSALFGGNDMNLM